MQVGDVAGGVAGGRDPTVWAAAGRQAGMEGWMAGMLRMAACFRGGMPLQALLAMWCQATCYLPQSLEASSAAQAAALLAMQEGEARLRQLQAAGGGRLGLALNMAVRACRGIACSSGRHALLISLH